MTRTRLFQLMTLYRTAQERLGDDPRWPRILKKVRTRLGWDPRPCNGYSDQARERLAETMWR